MYKFPCQWNIKIPASKLQSMIWHKITLGAMEADLSPVNCFVLQRIACDSVIEVTKRSVVSLLCKLKGIVRFSSFEIRAGQLSHTPSCDSCSGRVLRHDNTITSWFLFRKIPHRLKESATCCQETEGVKGPCYQWLSGQVTSIVAWYVFMPSKAVFGMLGVKRYLKH